ncbi:MAG: hypothetical protein ACK5LP_02720 [Campylobacteraceae bacterium]
MSDVEFDFLKDEDDDFVSSKILSLKDRLTNLAGVSTKIETFANKQAELFKILNEKFPNIQQFSNALKDANALLQTTKDIGYLTSESVKDLDVLSDDIKKEFEDINRQLQNRDNETNELIQMKEDELNTQLELVQKKEEELNLQLQKDIQDFEAKESLSKLFDYSYKFSTDKEMLDELKQLLEKLG